MSVPESLLADTILVNGNVITVDDEHPTAEAVAIKGDKIMYVGSNEEVRSCASKSTQVIDSGRKVGRSGSTGGQPTHRRLLGDPKYCG
jgi:adenine deaminase